MIDKAQRLAMVLENGFDVYHGTDMIEDMVEMCKHVISTSEQVDELNDELAEARNELKDFAEEVETALEEYEDSDEKSLDALFKLCNDALSKDSEQAADDMNVCRSTVEKFLAASTRSLNARNLRNAIYKAAKSGLIMICCVAAFNADEARRQARRRRDDDVTVIICTVS